MATKIEWTEKVWNPVTGCTKVSEACRNCYAEVMARRLSGMPGSKEKYKNGFNPTLHPECLEEPFSWKKPTMCFVVSMGDLFHRDVPFEFIDKVVKVIEDCPQHTSLHVSNAHKWHLWTIKDAKDGDVLSDGTTIFIFKDLLSDGSVMSYCDYDTDSGESDAFCPLSMNLMYSKITPATKEQRDTLMKAMADAGYIFDFEKKELKKIEQRIADNIPQDFEKYVEHLLSLSDVEGHGSPAKVKEVSAELFKLAKLEQKPAEWSEEDEKFINNVKESLLSYNLNSFKL